jgi:hypothetical protein
MRSFGATLMFAAGILLCTSLRADPAADSAIARARQAVRVQLYDPGSARFRNVKASAQGDVCGQVDSRNVEGGRTGFARFVYDHRTRTAALALRDPDFRQFFIMDDNEYTNGNAAVITDDACRFVRSWVGLCPSDMARREMHARALCALYDGGSTGRARLKRIVGAD